MYAEILELSSSSSGSDGIPSDLETGWIALPVPKGKRCLAVTYQGLGGAGEAVSGAFKSYFMTGKVADALLSCLVLDQYTLTPSGEAAIVSVPIKSPTKYNTRLCP